MFFFPHLLLWGGSKSEWPRFNNWIHDCFYPDRGTKRKNLILSEHSQDIAVVEK